jgi:hypothetical protein
MMIKLSAIACILWPACTAVGVADVARGGVERGGVFYFGFEIERITGLHEAEIQQHGCEYTIDRDAFYNLLLPAQDEDAVKYNESDVRAKVELGNSIYFVDRQGVVRTPKGPAIINKTEFVKSLKLVGACGARKREGTR